GGGLEAGAEEEVAIARQDVLGQIAGLEGRADARIERVVEVVVAGPVLEQVAEQIKCIAARHDILEEVAKKAGQDRPRGTEMQIGDEQYRHDLPLGLKRFRRARSPRPAAERRDRNRWQRSVRP